MSIQARPMWVAIDANSMVVVVTDPGTPISWSLEGNGTLTPIDLVTNDLGVAAAIVTPTGSVGDELIVHAEHL